MKRRLFIIALLSTFLSTLSCIPCCGQKHYFEKKEKAREKAEAKIEAKEKAPHHRHTP